MALAANAERAASPAPQLALQVVNAAEMYAGAMVGINTYTHGTDTSRGRLAPYNDANFLQPLGFGLQRKTGDTAASPIPTLAVDIGPQVREVSVAGGSSRETILRVVYATDDGTFTLTRPALGIPIGVIVDWLSGTTCKVYFFSLGELMALALSGQGRRSWLMGVVSGGAATGDVATGIVAPWHALIDSVYGIVVEPQTDADADLDYNLEIGGVNVTGGVIEFVTADLIGAKKAGTAITGANEIHEGDLIDIECVANTAGTAADGYMAIYANCFLLPGH